MKFTKKERSIILGLLILVTTSIVSYLRTGEFLNPFLPSPTPVVTGTDNSSERHDSLETVVVTRIIDGDTIEVNNSIKIRYIGIDTPESVDPRQEIECFGREAAEKNRELVLGKTVRLEKDVSETDRYGRLLRYVYVEDRMINEVLVSDGYAQASAYPPDVKYQEILDRAEEEARIGQRGIWQSCLE